MSKSEPRKVVPWFGSNTKLAEDVAQLLGPLRWCGVPFVGGASELKFIKTKIGVANDLHYMVINLFNVIRDPVKVEQLLDKLADRVYHVDELEEAQEACRQNTRGADPIEAAVNYFVASWMSRKGQAGTSKELQNGFASRWSSDGGDPVMEYNNAVAALRFWTEHFRQWAFLSMDAFAFLAKVKDQEHHGLYIDAPWPGIGGSYLCKFTEDEHILLSSVLNSYQHIRIVVRFGDHPLIRKLYPVDVWKWHEFESRTQSRAVVQDILLTKRCQG